LEDKIRDTLQIIIVTGSETATSQQQTTEIYFLPIRKVHKFDVVRDINSESATGRMPFTDTKYLLHLRIRGGNAQTVREIVCGECNLT
jgi:hypothetical protein